jgi:hypothetical protein
MPAYLCIPLYMLFFAFATVTLTPRQLHAQVLSQECCGEMLYPVGARTVALGQAVTAQPQTDAPFINPAGLADLTKTQVVVHRTSVADAAMTSFQLIIHSHVAGNFGIGYTGLEFAADEATDSAGATIGSITFFRQTLIASYATTIGLGWTAGVDYRLFISGDNCAGSCGASAKTGSTQMLDAGLRFAPRRIPNLLLGAALMQAGFPLQVNNAAQADPTPVRMRAGASYNMRSLVSRDSTIAAWVNVDVVQRIRDGGTPAVNVGLEVVLDNVIFLRAGHAAEAGGVAIGGSGIGLGLKYQKYDVNVAKGVSRSGLFPDPVYVSFGITF